MRQLGLPCDSSVALSRGCQVSAEAKQLIRALLERDPEKRLGGKKGAAEIRAHPFFADIDWALIRHKVSTTPRPDHPPPLPPAPPPPKSQKIPSRLSRCMHSVVFA